MVSQHYAYFFIEAAMFIAVCVIAYVTGALPTFATKRFLLIVAALYSFWVSLDCAARLYSVFSFPPDGNLPLRILGLPLEEHLFFPLHTATIWVFLVLVGGQRHRSEIKSG
jgi:hypothetical protein